MLLKVLPVSICRREKSIDTYALLDEGSTISLINRKLAREICARRPRINLTLKRINERETVPASSEKIDIKIKGDFGT